MPRIATFLAAASTVALLTFVPSAHATLNLTATSDSVVVQGDAGANRIKLADGDTSGGNDYAFAFYSEDREPVNLGDSGCVSNEGAPVETIYCGNASFNRAVFDLGAGSDTLNTYGSSVFDTLGSLTVEFGPGTDDGGSGIIGIETIIRGGDGEDDLAGHDGPSSVVEGGPGADRIVGGSRPTGEVLRGGDGDDSISGLSGNDEIFGDAGADALVGGAGGDTLTGGPGQDNVEGDGTVNAFSGNDTLQLTDGERDVGVCGFGADTVFGDSVDLLPAQDCESVTLGGGGGGGSGGGATPVGGGGGTAGSAQVTLARPGKLSARSRRLATRVTCPSAASGGCAGRVSFVASVIERGKRRRIGLGTARFDLAPGAARVVGRRLSKAQVRRLRRARNRRLTVRATSRDGAGRVFTSTRTATLAVGR